MTNINYTTSDSFKVNGIQYPRIYQLLSQGSDSVAMVNIYNPDQRLFDSVKFSDIVINDSVNSPLLSNYVPSSQSDAIDKILKICFFSSISPIFFASLGSKLDKGGYTGTAEDLKTEIDGITYEGLKTYQDHDDLPTPVGLDDGIIVKVVNDNTPANNGFYSVVSEVWVKDASIYSDIVNPTDTGNAVNGKAIGSYMENLPAFDEYKDKGDIGYSDLLKSGSSTFLTTTVKDFYKAFSYLELYGFDSTKKHKLHFFSRNEAIQKYRFIIFKLDSGTWVSAFDSGVFDLTESEGITEVERSNAIQRVKFGVNYSMLDNGQILRPNHYRHGGGFETGLNDTEFIISQKNIFDSFYGLTGYDQELNTTDVVEFNELTCNEITTSVLIANLPEGSGSAPVDVSNGQAWIDTLNDRVIKVKL